MYRIIKNNIDITQDVIEAFTQNIRNVGIRIQVANQITLTGKEIINCDIEEHILTGDKFNYGTANCSIMDLTIDNIGEPYDPSVFVAQEMKPYYTITTAKGDYVEVPMGVFVCDVAIKETNKIKITAYDRIILTEENYNRKTELTFPTTLKKIAQDAAQISRVPLSNEDFFNSNISYDSMVVFGTDVTCRMLLQNIAELACGFLHVDRNGLLKILDIVDTVNYSVLPKNYYKFSLLEQEFGPIKSVYCVYDEKDALVGEGSPQFQIRNNFYMPTDDLETFTNNIYNKIKTLKYQPAELEWQGVPVLEVGDFIKVTDKKGIERKILITSQKFTYNGGLKCVLKSVGKTDMELATDRKEIISEVVEGLNRRVNTLKQLIDKAKLDTILTELNEYAGRLDGLVEEFKKVQMLVTPDGIVNTVTSSKKYQDTIDGIYDGLNGLAGQTVTVESIIAQYADQINMSVKEGNLISSINLDKSGVQIRGDKIQLTGVVTFEDLAGEGKTIINGSNIVSGTIKGSKFEGDTFEVMAALNINAKDKPSYEYGSYIYPDVQKSGEWAEINFKINGYYNGTGEMTPQDISSVQFKTFAYGDNGFGDLPDNPKDWKYGLEVTGALRAKDDIFIAGENGLIIESAAGLQSKHVKTQLLSNTTYPASYEDQLDIVNVHGIWPAHYRYEDYTGDQPFISFEKGNAVDDPNIILTNIRSDGAVKINSINPTKYCDIETNNLFIGGTLSGNGNTPAGQTIGGYQSTSKIFTSGTLEVLYGPDTNQQYADIYCKNIYTQNGQTFSLFNQENTNTSGIVKTGDEQVIIDGETYYFALVNKESNKTIIVSSNKPGTLVWYDEEYKSEEHFRIVSNKMNTNCSYIICNNNNI